MSQRPRGRQQRQGRRYRPPPTEEQLDLQAAQDIFGPGVQAAERIADKWFPQGGLGRLDTATSDAMGGIVSDYDRLSLQYANGGRSGDQQGYIDRMNQIAGQYSDGGRTDEMGNVLGRYEGFLEGYSGEEGQAMREQAERGLNRAYNTGARQLTSAARRNRLSGAAQSAQLGDLNQQTLQAQGDVETDLAVRGADERRQALDAYADRLGTQEESEYQRQVDTALTAGEYYSDQEQSEYDRRRFANADRLVAQQNLEDRAREGNIYNMQQNEAEMAGRYGAYIQGLGIKDARKEAKLGHRENMAGIDAYREALGSRQSRSSNTQEEAPVRERASARRRRRRQAY